MMHIHATWGIIFWYFTLSICPEEFVWSFFESGFTIESIQNLESNHDSQLSKIVTHEAQYEFKSRIKLKIRVEHDSFLLWLDSFMIQ